MTDMQIPQAVLDAQARLADALERLLDDLADISPEDEREALIETLVAFSSFARTCEITPAWQGLLSLARQLNELKRGRVSPVFKPVPPGQGSVPDSMEVWQRRKHVLAAKRHLEKSEMGGMAKSEAARFIADAYPEVRALMTRGKDVPNTILRWETDLFNPKKSERHLSIWWDHIFNEIYRDIDTAALTFDEHKAAAIRILDSLFGRVTP